MRYFIIAGEASGDLHASSIMKEIRGLDSSAEFQGMGGPQMIHEGLTVVHHMDEMNFMGFYEVVRNLSRVNKVLKNMKRALKNYKPQKLILVDFGGFNLRMAKYAKQLGIEVHFYILPKVWAWNESRLKKIKQFVDKGYVIFPFEEEYFRRGAVDATYCGNPTVEGLSAFFEHGLPKTVNPKQIALLPGSRPQEIKRILPVMLSIVPSFNNYQFVIAIGNNAHLLPEKLPANVTVVSGSTYSIVYASKAAIVTSGTANLETALLMTPQIVVYKANPLSYFIGKRLVKIKFISPVNLILNKPLCRELIQNDCNQVTLTKAVEEVLGKDKSSEILAGYEQLRKQLGDAHPSKEVASRIIG